MFSSRTLVYQPSLPSNTFVPGRAQFRQNDATPPAQAEDEATRQAILNLVGVWLNRLSLVSGITTFFAGIDGQLLSYAYPPGTGDLDTAHRVAATSLAGALVFHWMAAIISYVGCFALYRYELVDAIHEEIVDSATAHKPTTSSSANKSIEKSPNHATAASSSFAAAPPSSLRVPIDLKDVRIYLTRIHPFGHRAAKKGPSPESGTPPTPGIPHLPVDLQRVHTACVLMSGAGFLCAVIGIMAYLWSSLPQYVSIFSTVCLGVCVIGGAIVVR